MAYSSIASWKRAGSDTLLVSAPLRATTSEGMPRQEVIWYSVTRAMVEGATDSGIGAITAGVRTAYVEGTDRDAEAAGALLGARGIAIVATPEAADMLVCDVWTPAIAPHVVAARAAGRRITCLAELVLAGTAAPAIGITGTAGKTSTARLLEAMLRAGGVSCASSQTARARQAWPNHELLDVSADLWLIAELTSSHLAFFVQPPRLRIGIVTSFWHDHVELHGTFEAYRDAKLRLVAGIAPDGALVLPSREPDLESFAAASRAPVVIADGPSSADLAAAAARLVGISATAIASVDARALDLPHRRRRVGMLAGRTLYDDSLAATPRKAAAAIGSIAEPGLVVLVGGDDRPATGRVHSSPAEERALSAALDLARTRATAVVAFGPAARRCPGAHVVATLEQALAAALTLSGPGDAILLAPMFPLTMDERRRFAGAAG